MTISEMEAGKYMSRDVCHIKNQLSCQAQRCRCSHDIEAGYQDALKWIHSSMRFGSKLGLERISSLLELLGNPQKTTKFIHVTGTNGKGSVTSIVASVLKEAGYRTGMYISPYLEDYRERIMLNGKKIPKSKAASLVDRIRPAVEKLIQEGFEHPTEFEVNTALGFLYFAQENCDYVALEVGMGGRFDATNIVTPVVSVITTIDFDHMDRLGNSLSEIAYEKAGIIKPGVPVVTGAVEQEALNVIQKRAAECGSDLTIVGNVPFASVTWEDVTCSIKTTKEESRSKDELSFLDGQIINISGPGYEFRNLKLPLLGRHQQQNAALAVAALKAARVRPLSVTALDPGDTDALLCETGKLNQDMKPKGSPTVSSTVCRVSPEQKRDNSPFASQALPASISLDEQGIRAGIARTVWPGRLEVMHRNPVVLLDGAHNPQGAKVLAEFLQKFSGKRIVCVYGILGNKCYKESTSLIAPLCDEIIVTKPHTPRALDPELLAREVRQYTDKVIIEDNSDKALELALSRVSSEDIVLCSGSLYLVGPARTFIRNKFGISPYGGE